MIFQYFNGCIFSFLRSHWLTQSLFFCFFFLGGCDPFHNNFCMSVYSGFKWSPFHMWIFNFSSIVLLSIHSQLIYLELLLKINLLYMFSVWTFYLPNYHCSNNVLSWLSYGLIPMVIYYGSVYHFTLFSVILHS